MENSPNTPINSEIEDDAAELVPFGKHAKLCGTLSPDILCQNVTVAFGRNRHDKNLENVAGTVAELLEYLSEFHVGPKDGTCMLQGELVGGQRIGKNMRCNSLIIVDIENGTTFDEVGRTINGLGLLGILNTTYSHGKEATEVNEDHFQRWHRRKYATAVPIEDTELQVALRAYLSEERRYKAWLVETCVYAGRQLAEGGMKYIVKHAPMPRLRLTLLRKTAHDFTAGASQRDSMDKWKADYHRVCDWIGVGYDSSCIDPSRLFYTPRIPPGSEIGEGKHEIVIFAGNPLDVDSLPVTTRPAAGDVGGLMSHVGANDDRPQHQFKTKNILSFVAKYPDFDIVSFVGDKAPEDRRSPGDSNKVDWACPNEDGHTKATPDDRAFMVSTDGERWNALCLHDGCKQASGGDRLWYLDLLCQKYGTEDAKELEEWSETARQADATKRATKATAESLIATISNLKLGDKVDDILKAIAETVESLTEVETLLAQIKAKTALPIGVLRTTVKSYRAIQPQNTRIPATDRPVVDVNSLNQEIEINNTWCAVAGYRECNPTDPGIYSTTQGLGRVARDGQGHPKVEAFSDMAGLPNALKPIVQFFDQEGAAYGRTVLCPSYVTRDMLADRNLKARGVPVLLNVSRTPKFGSDGKINTAPGYNASTLSWYEPDPTLNVPAVSEEPTPEEVRKAVSLYLDDLLEGFPFRDGTDPAKHSDDVEGLLAWDRRKLYGTASRANCLAMFLLPFVRAMISGATPFHLVNKRQPREGASLLTNLLGIVTTGGSMRSQSYTDDPDEIRKRITAVMLNPPDWLLFGNLEGVISGAEFKEALTTDEWEDRLLGQNTLVSGPVRWGWVGNGNNVALSKEIADRTQLITINTGVLNPNLRTDFKHADITKWTRENRGMLIWAALTIIQNWIVQRKPKDMSIVFGGFDDWARTMDGILKCAGVTGFRTNIGELGRGVDVETQTITALLAAWWEIYGDKPVKIGRHAAGYGETMTPEDGGLLYLIHNREITVGKIDPTKTAPARRMLAAWLQERRDGPREIEVNIPNGLGGMVSSKIKVKITIDQDKHTKSNVYCLRKLE